MHPYLHFLGRDVPLYWLLSLIGIFAAYAYVRMTNAQGRAGQVPAIDLLHIFLVAVAGALAGAKLLSILTTLPVLIRNWSFLVANPRYIFDLLAFGLVFYGGFLGGAAAVVWYCKKYGISLKETMALFTPAVPLFHTFGRIGCFMGGCCWGIPVPWGPVFTQSLAAPNGVPLLPIQLIESGLNFGLFLLLAALSRRLQRKWLVFPLYILLYSALRFVLEFFRGDLVRGVWILSTSQWISLVLMLSVLVLYFGRWRRHSA